MPDIGFRAWLLGMPMPPRTRARLLRAYGAQVGRNVRVHPLTIVNAGWKNLSLERDVYVGHDCILDLADQLTIGRGAVLAAGVSVSTHQDAGRAHGSPTAQRVGSYSRPVVIGRFAFIGTRAVVLADVGDGTAVGAGAVVVHALPSGVTAVGVPASSTRAAGESGSRGDPDKGAG